MTLEFLLVQIVQQLSKSGIIIMSAKQGGIMTNNKETLKAIEDLQAEAEQWCTMMHNRHNTEYYFEDWINDDHKARLQEILEDHIIMLQTEFHLLEGIDITIKLG